MKKIILSIGVALYAMSQFAFADNRGFYLQIGANQSELPVAISGPELAGIAESAINGLGVFSSNFTQSSSEDEDANGWAITGGFQLNNIVGFEVTYADLGESRATGTASGFANTFSGVFVGDVSAGVAYEVQALSVSTTVSASLGSRFKLFGKLGIQSFTTDFEISSAVQGTIGGVPGSGSSSSSDSEDGIGLLAGAGFAVEFVEGWQVIGELVRYADIDIGPKEIDIDTISLSLRMTF